MEVLDCMEHDVSGRKREFCNLTTVDKHKIDSLMLNLKDILYFEYMKTERKIKIVCKEDCYEFSYVMQKLAEELREYGFTVNCRGMLVNMRHIRKVKGYLLYMDNGQELAISQKRKGTFVKEMNVFIHNHLS